MVPKGAVTMSQQKDLLWEIAAATSSDASDRISDWVIEDFRLHEPGKPALPVGHEGPPNAGGGRPNVGGIKNTLNVEILDMIEEGGRVTVRLQVTATEDDGKPYERSIMAIYRFENGTHR
jgi:ketosteroid isomerase-like protein